MRSEVRALYRPWNETFPAGAGEVFLLSAIICAKPGDFLVFSVERWGMSMVSVRLQGGYRYASRL